MADCYLNRLSIVDAEPKNASAGKSRHWNRNGVPGESDAQARLRAPEPSAVSAILQEQITGRKGAEERLSESEDHYRNVAETATDAIITTDEQGVITFVNRAAEKVFGWASAHLFGLKLTMLIPGYLRHVQEASLKNYVATGNRQLEYWEPINLSGLRKGGNEIPVELSVSRFTKNDSHVFTCIIRDITEREAGRASLLRLAAIVESSSDAIIGYALDGTVTTWNPGAERLFGYTAAEAIGRSFTIVVPEDRASRALRILEETGREDSATRYETVRLNKNGTRIDVSMTVSPIRDSAGKVIGASSIARDIGEQKRADENLRSSEERYRDIVENAHDIIYSHDLLGNYISINKAYEQITGYSREEALTMNLAQTVAPESLEKAREMIARKLDGESVTAYDLNIIGKDGRRIAVEVNSKLVLQDGAPVGVLGIARDVTARKQLEDQLRHSQKMEAIGQLAGGIAHDFNNLLTAIIGYSELSMKPLRAADPLLNNLQEIKKAGDRAASLTRQLLAFSRKQVLQPKVLDLNAVVSDLETMLRRLIGEDLELSTVLDPKVGAIKVDPGQIEQIILNLAVNARDAMPRGGTLTIETKNVFLDDQYAKTHVAVTPGPFVMLAVSDSGTGIDPQTRSHIFEPFFTTKEVGKGTGLGLSTVYGIVKQSGGNVLVHSEVGLGTTFKIYLPRTDESPPLSERDTGSLGFLRGTETALLVEDEEIVRKLACQVLRLYGYQVLEAVEGMGALRICKSHPAPIHLLITDVIMPGMSGRELAGRLTELRPEMQVLYMSGYTDRGKLHQGFSDIGANFIQKPFSTDVLAIKVREVLDARRGAVL
jgi:PAS domain S-box-containing protein